MTRRNFWTRFVAAWFGAIMLMYVLTPSLKAQAVTQTLYMPILQAADSGDIGLALSNPTLADVTVTLIARDYAGASISGSGITNPTILTLPASGQRALRAVEIFGIGVTGKVGWVELQSSSTAVKGFFLVFDSRVSFIDGAELQSRPAGRLVFPKVSGNPASPTTITYINTGTDPLRLSALTFYDNSGRPVAKTYLTLAPKSGFTGSIIDAIPGAAGLEGYAVLETATLGSVEALVGFETYRNNTDVAALNAVPDTAASRISYLPHFASGGGYVTRLSLVNFTNESQTLMIAADSLEKDGVAQTPSVASVNRTIPAKGRLEESAESLFRLTGPSLYIGYIKWETQGNTRGVIGYLDYGTTDGVLLSAVAAQSTSYSDLFFSHIAEGLGYYTGIALLNTNTQTTTVNIDAFEKNGRKVAGTTVTLTAGQRRSRIFTELFSGLTTQLGGYVRVSASRPIFAFQLFGSRTSLSFLANVAAQGAQLQPQASGRVVSAAAGANVISADGNASIAIPPGALASDTAVSLNNVTVTLPSPFSTQQVVAAVDAQPSGTTFKIPVRVTFSLSAQLTPGTLMPVLIFTTQGYQDSGFIAIVDESGRTASAEVTHFTTFALGLNTDQLINVTSISPSSGLAGATVTIGDSGFGANASDNIVTFAGAENTSIIAAVTAATSTLLTLRVPTGAITGNVIVRVGTKTSTGIKFAIPADRPRPSLRSISPVSLLAGITAAEIKVMGTGFQNASIIRIDGTPVATTFVDATLLLASISGAQVVPGVHKLTIFTPTETGGTGGGESGLTELTIGFPVPKISSLSPSTAEPANGSVTVTITGTGFINSSTATVNGADSGATFVNNTTMTIVLNSNKAIDLPIMVSNPSPAGGSSGTAVFTFGEQPVGAINLLSTANPTGTINTAIPIQVEVRKKNDSVLGSYPVSFSIAAGNGSVTPDAATTDNQGRASTTLTLGMIAGINTVKVTSGSVNVFFSAIGTNTTGGGTTGGGGGGGGTTAPGPAAKVSLSSSPTSIQAGSPGTTIAAQVQDQFGSLRNDAVNGITFSVTAGNGNLSATAVTAAAGVATTTLTSTSTGAITIQGSAAGLTSGTTSVIVTPAAPANLTATGGAGQSGQAGVALGTALKVQVKDAFGNVVPGVAVTFSVVSGGGSVNPASGTANSNGEASTAAIAGGAFGTQTFRAASTGLTSVDFNAAIAQGPAAKLALSTGGVTTLVAGNTSNLTVAIQDAFGNAATNATNAITIASNITGSPIGAVVGTTNGVAASTFSGQLAGSYIITASSGTLTAATASIAVTAGPAVALVKISGDGQTGGVGAALAVPLVVEARDVFGNVKSGVAVTLTVTGGNGSVTPTGAQTTGSNGRIQVAATLGTAVAAHQFTASAPNLTSVIFSATGTLIPATITKTAGDSQTVGVVGTGNPGIVLDTLKVHVVNTGGIVVPNATINWAASGGGSVSALTSLTDVNGDATITATASTTAAANTFTAAVNGTSLSVTFTTTVRVLTSTPGAIDVQIASGTTVIGSYDVTIHFDPAKVRITCDDGTLNCLASASITGGSASQYSSFSTTRINNAGDGQVQVNQFQTNQTAPKGNFTVAHITFTPIRTGNVTLSTTGVVVTDNLSNGVSTSFLSLSAPGLTIN